MDDQIDSIEVAGRKIFAKCSYKGNFAFEYFIEDESNPGRPAPRPFASVCRPEEGPDGMEAVAHSGVFMRVFKESEFDHLTAICWGLGIERPADDPDDIATFTR